MITPQEASKLSFKESLQGYPLSDYDFLVLGNCVGTTIDYGKTRFKLKAGLGIDTNHSFVVAERKKGYDVAEADWTILRQMKPQSFKSGLLLRYFLTDRAGTLELFKLLANLCTDFIYFRYPSFDEMAYLKTLGLRQFWTNWTGNRIMLRLDQMFALFDEAGFQRYFVRRRGPITETSHPSIIPFNLPKDQSAYDPIKHGPRPVVKLEAPVWQETEFFIPLRPYEVNEWHEITQKQESK